MDWAISDLCGTHTVQNDASHNAMGRKRLHQWAVVMGVLQVNSGSLRAHSYSVDLCGNADPHNSLSALMTLVYNFLLHGRCSDCV